MRSGHGAVVLLALSLLAPASAWASNGPMPTTVGTKGPVAMPVDGDGQTMFRMPSSIGWSLDHQLDVDLFLVYTDAKMRNAQNDFHEGSTSFGGSIGVVFAPGRPDWDAPADGAAHATPAWLSRFTVGFGVYPDIAGGAGEDDRVRYTTFPETVKVEKSISFLTSALNLTFRPTDWLALGVGLHLIYATVDFRTPVGGNSTPLEGSPTINGVPIPGNPTYADFLGLFASDGASDPTTYFDGELAAIQFSATLSISLRPFDRLGLAFSYRDRSWAPRPFEGEAEISAERTFDNALAGLDPALRDLFLATLPRRGQDGFTATYDAELRSMHVPRQVRLSMAFWPFDRLLLAAEVAWIEWHRAFGLARVTLEDGSNQDINFVSGSSRIDTRLDTRWRNTWVFSLYAAYGLTDALTLRVGFSYGESPFNVGRQENTPTAGYVNTNLSAGLGWWVTDSLELNALLEYSPAASQDSDGEAQSLTGQFTTYTSSQVFVHLGLSWRF